MNGKPGDHPINDICDHGLEVFSPKADELIRKIHTFLPRYRMWDLFDWRRRPPIEQFEALLEQRHKELLADAAARGWEVGQHGLDQS